MTGGNGFIGSYTNHFFDSLGVRHSNIDLRKHRKETFKNPISILHLGWSGVWGDEDAHDNLESLEALFDLCEDSPVANFVFASSSSVYGNRWESGEVNEDRTLNPVGVYANEKAEAERRLARFSESSDIPTVVLRYSSVYGPGQKGGFIKEIMDKVACNLRIDLADRYSDFVFVGDVARANLQAVCSDKSGIYNIGYGKPCKRSDAVEAIIKLMGSRSVLSVQPTSSQPTVFSIEKAKRELNYSPTVSLENGLKAMLKREDSCRLS